MDLDADQVVSELPHLPDGLIVTTIIMISPTDNTWRAVRLRDKASVEYLNRLFAEGWHLMRIEADGLPYLGFEMPVEPPPWTTPKSIHTRVDAERLPRVVMIVLRRGDQRDRQRAVYLERDDTGHFDFGTIELRGREWAHFTGISMEDGNRCEVFEKDADGPLFRPMSLRRR